MSIACDGVCLTLVSIKRNILEFNLSQETINRRDGCPEGTECISVFNKNTLSMISYDSCGDRAMTCEYSSH